LAPRARAGKDVDFDPVFSAPKYCDTTENKGAYINIGPELELDFHKFDAVPHPPIRPMVDSPPLSESPYIWLTSVGIRAKFAHLDDDVRDRIVATGLH
jgi:hypothetical protein